MRFIQRGMKRTPLLRRVAMVRTGRLRRTAISQKPSAPQQRQQSFRRTAYAVVDRRAGGQCEVAVDAQMTRCLNAATDHHHRRARGAGGSTDPETETPANLIASCRTHHQAIHAKPALSRTLGLIVAQSGSPAATPATLFCGSVLLTNDGKYREVCGD